MALADEIVPDRLAQARMGDPVDRMGLHRRIAAGQLVAALRASFEKIGVTNALVIAGAQVDNNLKLAARNIPNVDVLPNAGLNVYDVLRRHTLVLTKDAVDAINARFAEKEAA